jgi:hypothetical protein
MRLFASFSILFTLTLLLLAPKLAAALFTSEAEEIPYQINNSDRIVIGTVSEIDVCDYYTNNSITVKEWLYNPLPEKTIIVRNNIGTNVWTEDEAEFTQNESVLLMLMDQRPDKGVFRMFIGFPGKHPVSDRDAVIEALKAQVNGTKKIRPGIRRMRPEKQEVRDQFHLLETRKITVRKSKIVFRIST